MGLVSAPVVQAQGLAGPYLAARQAGLSADYAEAAVYYTQALVRDPGNPLLLESAAHAQVALGNLALVVPMARRLEDDGLKSQIADMILIADEAAKGSFDVLVTRIEEERGVGLFVDGLVKAWALMGAGKVTQSLAAFDAVAQERGMKGFALYHKALALAQVGDYEAAEAIFADTMGAEMQTSRRSVIARLEVLSQLERGEDAVEMLDDLFGTELDPSLTVLRQQLLEGDVVPVASVRSAADGIAEVFHSVAVALNSEADQDYTLLFSRVAEFLRPDHTDAILLSAQLLDALQRYDLAVDAYKKVGTDNPYFHAAELGRADSLRRAGRVDAATEVLEKLTQTHPTLPIVHVTLGDLKRQIGDHDKAVIAYDDALALYEAPKPAQWFVYYARAISHERLGAWDSAEQDFRTALKLNPDQPQVLNYLGYSLVEQQIKLDEALSMIERAVAVRPDSGYIVDSLGWVLFRLGRYEEAVPHMERAASLMPVDPVVNDHLGDTLWAVGRIREAEFQWRRALSFVDREDASGEVKPDRIRLKL
ncbi:MAG: tetratricopeptide repeat protein, partial [Thalassovita sp.]